MNAKNRGEYEYEIDLPQNNNKVSNIIDSVGSNPGSVIGHYADLGSQTQNGGNNGSQININSNFGGLNSNVNVKKSMMKIGAERNLNEVRDNDLDMSPASCKNEINFHNQNQSWKMKQY